MATMLNSGCIDGAQWLSITEESLMLHDGLIRVTDLVELPCTDGNNSSDADQDVVNFDSKNPQELSDKILELCSTQNNAYTRLLQYRLNALGGLWSAQRQAALEQKSRDSCTQEETIALLKKQGLWQQVEPTSFASRVGLLLVFPLLQSQSRVDRGLCATTTRLLLQCLKECPPLSLGKEPVDCLNGLETLLSSWLADTEQTSVSETESTAAALVALACARGSMKSFIHTVHLLQNLKVTQGMQLPVGDILSKLLELEGGVGCPSSILGSKHVVCWGFEDLLAPATKKEANAEKEKELDLGRSLACDGKFLYTTNSSGYGIAKIGSGLHGTMRGFVYVKNDNIGPGRVAMIDGKLLFRPHEFDGNKKMVNLAITLNLCTLMPEDAISLPEHSVPEGTITTIQFCSDGWFIYWMWCPGTVGDKQSKGQPIFLDVFAVSDGTKVSAAQNRLLLQRKDDTTGKSLNENLLARLRSYRQTATATLVALTGNSTVYGGSTQETSPTSTSCGLPLKTLLRAPIYTCGNYIVILVAPTGNASNATTRSLFGSGSSLTSLRSLATNLCFSVKDGLFVTRNDLIDAPMCGLMRGASLPGMGICYDALNNMIWTCTNEWVDQYYNPGHHATVYISQRLGVLEATVEGGERVKLKEVIRSLLLHVGSMCCHQMSCDLLHTPLGSLLMQQQPVDLGHLGKVLDILQVAVNTSDDLMIRCSLIALQVMFKALTFKQESELEVSLVQKLSSLLWQLLLSSTNHYSANHSFGNKLLGVQAEACNVICAGLSVLYPDPKRQSELLHRLLVEGSENFFLAHLRDLVLMQYTEQLQSGVSDPCDLIFCKLDEDLVQYLLKVAVKESCALMRSCFTRDKKEFDNTISSVPVSSPCLRYLGALQNHLCRELVLFPCGEQMAQEGTLEKLQLQFLNFATKVFSTAYEALEAFLEVCNTIINSEAENVDARLQGLERVAKGTILGYLLPILITVFTHTNSKHLMMADSLMSQLVQLVILTSQAALLLKNQSNVSKRQPSKDKKDLLSDGCECDLNLNGKEEPDFLAGLKIPAPWATGKTVESIHPVRDNYKFKETVHIPGARCLYLRFDPRCSSQYDYDKLVVYAGADTGSLKVAEFGGNTYGFGSRSVLGSGWPKDLMKVDGDVVTFAFEMRSGREHNTPDKAMWGFFVNVRAQESGDVVSSGLPFLADLALGFSVLSCNMLQILYQGPSPTCHEILCKPLLDSPLMQRCVIPSFALLTKDRHVDVTIDEEKEFDPSQVKSTPLDAEVLAKFREISGCACPQLRPSIRNVICIHSLESKVMGAVVKHLALPTTVRQIAALQEQSDKLKQLCRVLATVYSRLDSLIRRLQALAELEQRWHNEVEDVRQGMIPTSMAFFAEYQFADAKMKEMSMLCFLKDVDFEGMSSEAAVTHLREKLEAEAYGKELSNGTPFLKTCSLVSSILERADLLLAVHTVDCNWSSAAKSLTCLPRTDTDSSLESANSKPAYSRSLSAPSELESTQESTGNGFSAGSKKRSSLHRTRGTCSILEDIATGINSSSRSTLDQIFSIISSRPERRMCCEDFMAAIRVRHLRGKTRTRSLVHMKELLTATNRVGSAAHLVAAVTSVLQKGPRSEELTCGGMVSEVCEAFAETITSVVQLAARYPIAFCNSIGLLCVTPYSRNEEKCLVQSGLVHLLDRLCSLNTQQLDSGSSEANPVLQRVAATAWAGFQVLSDRCVSWEADEYPNEGDPSRSGLARQVATLLTNHLSRAADASGNGAAGSEALQEILGLLNNLSRSKMGKAILSQPGCVSKLLSLLLDQRPSPKLVLVILQLCRVALPLMSSEDCCKVEFPSWNWHSKVSDLAASHSDVPSLVAQLLLAKLADYIVPGHMPSPSRLGSSSQESLQAQGPVTSVAPPDKALTEENEVQDGRLSVFLHKSDDQLAHDVIQPFLSAEGRLFRLGGGISTDKVERVTRDLNRYGKAEVCTEDSLSALKRAAKWAQSGLVVSTGPALEANSVDHGSDRKKASVDVICKERNSELAKSDPVRVFVSGHVANSMASEVIALLHNLLSTNTTRTWATAVERVLSDSLSCLPKLLKQAETLGTQQCNVNSLFCTARHVLATLCALGGFKGIVKPGSQALLQGSVVRVISVSEQQEMANVQFLESQGQGTKCTDAFKIPLCRLEPLENHSLRLEKMSLTREVVEALQVLLQPDGGRSLLQNVLPSHSDMNNLMMSTWRVLAQIQTRACMVLADFLKDASFASAFVQRSASAVEVLKLLAKECNPRDRLKTVESHCLRLRMLYRDCAKPPPPPSRSSAKQAKEIAWDTLRSYPPVRASLMSHNLTGITFLGDLNVGSNLPRGTFVYATQPVPHLAPSFYWELEICSLGDHQDDSGPVVSFGFAPPAERRDGAWINPIGTVLYHNNSRAVHYNGPSLLQWKSVRLGQMCLNAGDIAGCGWEKMGDLQEPHSQQARGTVFFTHNGQRLPYTLEDVAGGLWPVVHIQKKGTRVKANFGARPFAYTDGHHHVRAADEALDSTDEISATFGLLPFHVGSDKDSETCDRGAVCGGPDGKNVGSPQGTSCRIPPTPKANKEYDVEASSGFKLQLCYDDLTVTGPDTNPVSMCPDDESDAEDGEEDFHQQEGHHALLVKAWESKVFPVIRRRFRNEAERKDGLEQIRGALQLGMTDIARQTVEFLYEENGGIPRDLYLPTLEDIKEEASKFTVECIRKGTAVVIRSTGAASAGTSLPKYAVHGMLKTFGLPGVVLDVDSHHELVQVETYLRSEGVLVRFWYPLDTLERPPHGTRKNGITGVQVVDTNSLVVHRELVSWEHSLARLYCRSAVLALFNSQDALKSSVKTHTLCSCQEHLQLLSNEMLAPNVHRGQVFTSLLRLSETPKSALASQSCLASDMFYNDCGRLKQVIASAVNQSATHGEDQAVTLTSQICSCLHLAPEGFSFYEFSVTESKLVMDVFFPKAAFLIITCKNDPAVSSRWTQYQSPWARIFSYNGCQFNKCGQPNRLEVLCYPEGCRASAGCSQQISVSNQYPPAIIAGDRVHVRCGGSPSPGIIVAIHSIPQELPLALAYIEQVLKCARKDLLGLQTTGNKKACKITSGVLVHIVELLAGYILKMDIASVLKERIFHLVAEALRTLHFLQMEDDKFGKTWPKFGPSPSFAVLLQLQIELKKLHEEESKSWSVCGTPSGFGFGQQGRFSTYFHSLMEVCLAVAEINSTLLHPSAGTSLTGHSPSSLDSPPPPPTPSSPSPGGKRKKLKAKRDRDKSSAKMLPGASSVCDAESGVGTGDVDGEFGGKSEDIPWFQRALSVSQMLRFLIYGDRQGAIVTSEAVCEAFKNTVQSTVHSRLLIIAGIPTHLQVSQVKKAIATSLYGAGGLNHNMIFVPKVKNSEKAATVGNCGMAVVEIRSRSKVEAAKKALLKNKILLDVSLAETSAGDDIITAEDLTVTAVDRNLQPTGSDDVFALDEFLKDKLFSCEGSDRLRERAITALTDIFHSCLTGPCEIKEESGLICLSKEQILHQATGNLLNTMLSNMRPSKIPLPDMMVSIMHSYGVMSADWKDDSSSEEKPDYKKKTGKGGMKKKYYKEKLALGLHVESNKQKDKPSIEKFAVKPESNSRNLYLTLDGFMQYVCDTAKVHPRSVWLGLLSSGFDLDFNRVCCVDAVQAQLFSKLWMHEMDCALVNYVNNLCRHLAIATSCLHPHEVHLSSAELLSAEYLCLQGVPVESIRLRVSLLQSVNDAVMPFLPLVDMRPVETHSLSIAATLARGRGIVFYNSKVTLMNCVLNATAVRKPDQAAPEIVLDPLESIGNEPLEMSCTQFYQAMSQLKDIPSGQFCVGLASGGDPMYSFNVRLLGEEVHGTSGSFRHFLSEVSKELQGPVLDLLVPCPSSNVNRCRGKYLLRPGPMQYVTEKMLQFFGQLLGITVRADIPLPVNLAGVFWKCLIGMPVDPVADLQDVDYVIHSYIKEFSTVENGQDLMQLLEDHHNPCFVYSSICGEKVELCSNGKNIPVSADNLSQYVSAIRNLRLRELMPTERYDAIRAGLASIIPIQLLNVMTPTDIEMRICGLPEINLHFLKAHTMYQVGLMETDAHIEYFWNVLETFTKEELCKFVKFACNQDRIPASCPCKDGEMDTIHVPPYPMKIAPPDGRAGSPDSRYIRVETCMFMLKLPQYSCEEVMRERLLYAIYCRDDPLSG